MDTNGVRVGELAKHVWLVALVGEHDLSTADEVEAAISGRFDAGSSVVLDLSEATFIDSTVLAAVLRAQDRADLNRADELVVVVPEGSPARRVFDVVRFDERIQLCESRAAAMEHLTYR